MSPGQPYRWFDELAPHATDEGAGAQGPAGPTGAQGPQGETGPEGPAGEGVDPASDQTITGEWVFADTAEPTTATLIVPTLDAESGEPVPAQGFLLTAVEPGSQGNLHIVCLAQPLGGGGYPPNQPLSVAIVNDGVNGETIYITLPTDESNSIAAPTAAQLVDVINSTPAVAARVVSALPAGSSGTDVPIPGGGYYSALSGGTDPAKVRLRHGMVTSPLRVQPDELDAVPVTLRTADGSILGTAVINIEYRDGEPTRTVNGYTYGITHLDNDGGGGLASDRITWSENGNLRIDVPQDAPLVLKRAGMQSLTFMDGFSDLGIGQSDVGRRVLTIFPTAAAVADLVTTFDPEDGSTERFRLRPSGAVITMGTEPADADLAPGQCAWWFDPTPGAAQVRFKGKDSAGTVVDLTP